MAPRAGFRAGAGGRHKVAILADMMTLKQRKSWAEYFEKEGIKYKFFSAAMAKRMNEKGESNEYDSEEDEDDVVLLLVRALLSKTT